MEFASNSLHDGDIISMKNDALQNIWICKENIKNVGVELPVIASKYLTCNSFHTDRSREIFRKTFPDGCLVSHDNMQKLLDEGMVIWDIMKFSLSGYFKKGRNEYWYKEGLLHRDDGPAIVFSDGSRYWYVNGICIKQSS